MADAPEKQTVDPRRAAAGGDGMRHTGVVTSNVNWLPEVVGDAVVLVNPENVFDIARGIRDVLPDEGLRAELVRRGREQAARFSRERTGRQMLEIDQEAVGG